MRLSYLRRLFPLLCFIAGVVVTLNLHETFFRDVRIPRLPTDGSLHAARYIAMNPAHRFHGHLTRNKVNSPAAAESDRKVVKPEETDNTNRDLEGYTGPRSGMNFSNKLFSVQGKFKFAPLSFTAPIFPDETNITIDDRIWNQMRYIPPKIAKGTAKMKKILLFNGLGGERGGQYRFLQDKCPVNKCEMTDNRREASSADLIMWMHSVYGRPFFRRPKNQVWVVYLLESPYHTPSLREFRNLVNYTATYRHESTIVAPYYKFTPYNPQVLTKPQHRNYAKGKTKKVAWFVSNCGARNGRLQFAKELGQHIEVDIFGACGSKRCPRFQANSCFEMLNKDYKFYLAFENSNCRDYITEKFFLNGLSQDVLPIVMGAHPDDYRRVAPVKSFIHVDDFSSVKELANYLHILDKNDNLYNEYFAWKGTGLVDTNCFFWCRLCMMAHEAENHNFTVPDPETFWRGPGICTDGRWTGTKRA